MLQGVWRLHLRTRSTDAENENREFGPAGWTRPSNAVLSVISLRSNMAPSLDKSVFLQKRGLVA